MLIDILFNVYDNLIKTNNKNKICEWLINLQLSDIFENQIKFLQVVANFLTQINLKTLSITTHPFFTSLEIIVISFKFIFAWIINDSNFSKFTHSELKNYSSNENISYLNEILLKFIVESSLFYTSLSNKNYNIDVKPLIKNFILIVESLTSSEKYQAKLFMNYLYSNLVEKKKILLSIYLILWFQIH